MIKNIKISDCTKVTENGTEYLLLKIKNQENYRKYLNGNYKIEILASEQKDGLTVSTDLDESSYLSSDSSGS